MPLDLIHTLNKQKKCTFQSLCYLSMWPLCHQEGKRANKSGWCIIGTIFSKENIFKNSSDINKVFLWSKTYTIRVNLHNDIGDNNCIASDFDFKICQIKTNVYNVYELYYKLWMHFVPIILVLVLFKSPFLNIPRGGFLKSFICIIRVYIHLIT